MSNILENLSVINKPTRFLTFEEHHQELKEKLEKINPTDLEGLELERHNYRAINLQRTNRIIKTYSPSQEIIDAVNKINDKQNWIVITEDWCGDSAQTIPYIQKFISHNPNIELKIILRDDNYDFADEIIKEGNPRSIPRVLAFDELGNLVFMWGSRPKEAQEIVTQGKAQGKTKEEFNKDLHLWYGRDRGKTLEKEFIEILNSL
jgi:hypothetical protein